MTRTKIIFEDQIRRFSVDSFKELQTKVISILKRPHRHVIEYRDDESWIRLESEDEFAEALTVLKEMKQEVLMLRVIDRKPQMHRRSPLRRGHGQNKRHMILDADFTCIPSISAFLPPSVFGGATSGVIRNRPHHHGRRWKRRAEKKLREQMQNQADAQEKDEHMNTQPSQQEEVVAQPAPVEEEGETSPSVERDDERSSFEFSVEDRDSAVEESEEEEDDPVTEEEDPVAEEQEEAEEAAVEEAPVEEDSVEDAPSAPEKEPEQQSAYPHQQQVLSSMGFDNDKLNEHVLRHHKGDITRAINALLKFSQQQ